MSSFGAFSPRRVVPNFSGFFCRFPQLSARGAFQGSGIVSGGFGGLWLLWAFCGVLGGLSFWAVLVGQGSGLVCHYRATLRNRSGIVQVLSCLIVLRKLSALFCLCVGASVRPNSQMTRPSASASANSQFDRASARASANSQMPNSCLASANSQIDLTSDGR